MASIEGGTSATDRGSGRPVPAVDSASGVTDDPTAAAPLPDAADASVPSPAVDAAVAAAAAASSRRMATLSGVTGKSKQSAPPPAKNSCGRRMEATGAVHANGSGEVSRVPWQSALPQHGGRGSQVAMP